MSFKLPSKKISRPDNFSGEFDQSFVGKIKLTLHKYFQKINEKGNIFNIFYIELPDTKLDRHYKKKKYSTLYCIYLYIYKNTL